MKNERELNTEIVRSLKYYNFFAYKISDVMGSRFTETKPCDILACSPHGEFIAIESKLMKKWQGFNKNVLRENQIQTLNRIIRNSGRAFVFLGVSIKADKKKGIQKESWLIIFDWAIHKKAIMGKGYSPNDLREGLVGDWRTNSKNSEGKIIWDIETLLE